MIITFLAAGIPFLTERLETLVRRFTYVQWGQNIAHACCEVLKSKNYLQGGKKHIAFTGPIVESFLKIQLRFEPEIKSLFSHISEHLLSQIEYFEGAKEYVISSLIGLITVGIAQMDTKNDANRIAALRKACQKAAQSLFLLK